jgi:hypothetical protein
MSYWQKKTNVYLYRSILSIAYIYVYLENKIKTIATHW